MDILLVGPAARPELLAAVIGDRPQIHPHALPGQAVVWDGIAGRHWLTAGPGLQAARITGLDPGKRNRLSFYLTVIGAAPCPQSGAEGLWCGTPLPKGGRDWSPDGPPPDLAVRLAEEILRLRFAHSADSLARRLPHLIAQTAGRLRAETPVPARLRHQPGAGDLQVLRRATPYADFFAVEQLHLRHRRFDGATGPELSRAVFVSGDAVSVLPYDPRRDQVLLVEQLRPGPLVRGQGNPYQLEAIAGRIDPGETPLDAARREAAEEAGLSLPPEALRPITRHYPSPGTASELLHSFLAIADLPDGSAGLHGLASEDEDIRGHLIPFDRLMDLLDSGEIDNSLTVLSALWLARARAGLRR